MAALFVLMTLVLGVPRGEIVRGEVAFRPGPAEATVPERFRLSPSVFPFELEPALATERYTVSRLRFPSPITTIDPENNLVHAEYFRPTGEGPRRPAVVVLHILGADFALSRYMAARMADRGVAALFLKLPYYGERRPATGVPDARKFVPADIERMVTAWRQGICDVRRAAAWLATRPEVDPDRIGVAGISLGGIVASIAVAVDPKIHEGAFLLAGGDLATILWTMPEGKAFRAAGSPPGVPSLTSKP